MSYLSGTIKNSKATNSGRKASNNGRKTEAIVASLLDQEDFIEMKLSRREKLAWLKLTPQERGKDVAELGGKVYIRQLPCESALNKAAPRVDFRVYGFGGYPDGLNIEVKSQIGTGSTDEKIFSTIENIRKTGHPTIIVLVGPYFLEKGQGTIDLLNAVKKRGTPTEPFLHLVTPFIEEVFIGIDVFYRSLTNGELEQPK